MTSPLRLAEPLDGDPYAQQQAYQNYHRHNELRSKPLGSHDQPLKRAEEVEQDTHLAKSLTQHFCSCLTYHDLPPLNQPSFKVTDCDLERSNITKKLSSPDRHTINKSAQAGTFPTEERRETEEMVHRARRRRVRPLDSSRGG